MVTTIKIIQKDNDKCDYTKAIVELLNKRFTSVESMEQNFKKHCLDVAQELCGQLIIDQDVITFDFSRFN